VYEYQLIDGPIVYGIYSRGRLIEYIGLYGSVQRANDAINVAPEVDVKVGVVVLVTVGVDVDVTVGV
jgi:phosphoribulokinase